MLIHNVLCLLPTSPTCIPMEGIIKIELRACIPGIQLLDVKEKLLEPPVYASEWGPQFGHLL